MLKKITILLSVLVLSLSVVACSKPTPKVEEPETPVVETPIEDTDEEPTDSTPIDQNQGNLKIDEEFLDEMVDMATNGLNTVFTYNGDIDAWDKTVKNIYHPMHSDFKAEYRDYAKQFKSVSVENIQLGDYIYIKDFVINEAEYQEPERVFAIDATYDLILDGEKMTNTMSILVGEYEGRLYFIGTVNLDNLN